MPRRVLIASLVAALIYLPSIPSGAGAPEVSPVEQWFIYDVNRARSDPAGYAAEHGINVSNPPAPLPPLAVSDELMSSTGTKVDAMNAYNQISHLCPVQGSYAYCPDHVAFLAGYPINDSSSNTIEIIWGGGPGGYPTAGVFLSQPQGTGHRALLFEWTDRREVGAGLVSDSTTSYFATHVAVSNTSPGQPFVTGVVYDDANANCIMDLGEGLGGVNVSIPGAGSDTTNAGGGYSVPVTPNSTYQMNVSGGGVSASATAVVGTGNVGLDFIRGETTAIPPGCVDRWWGVDRYETAADVSKAMFPAGAAVVYLASGVNFPDAIAAGPAAAAENAPILLAQNQVIPPSTEEELVRLAPSTVVIIGGTAALSDTVRQRVQSLLPGVTIDRRHGPTRYETAAAISARAFPQGADTVFVVTGTDFPDALPAAPAAVDAGGPLLLVPSQGIPAAVGAELARLRPKRIEIVGSPSVIPESLKAQLAGYATQGAYRTYGSNRYATSVLVSQLGFPGGSSTVYIAVGDKFPDALAGGAATGVVPGPILLVAENWIPDVVKSELTRLGPSRIIVLGGPAAVSSLVASQLAAYLD